MTASKSYNAPYSYSPVADEILDSFENTQIAYEQKSDLELNWSYFLFRMMNNDLLTKLGTTLTDMAFQFELPVDGFIKFTLFQQFCGGETLSECRTAVRKLGHFNVKSILDYSSEGDGDEESFDWAVEKILETLEVAQEDCNVPFIVFKPSGLAPTDILEAVSDGETLSGKEQAAYERVKARFYRLGKSAYDAGIPVMIDAEESWLQAAIDDLATEMMREFNREKCIVINTVQMYRKDRHDFLQKQFEQAEKENYFLGVKLVRGAYMEKERASADELGYESPIHDTKEDTDRNFNAALDFIISHIDRILLCSGSHNEESNAHLAQLMASHNIPKEHPHVLFSQLFGMGDHISFNLADKGYQVSKYVPYGPVKAVLAYLFRRAEENSSISGYVSRELRLLDKEMSRRHLPH
ncbi:Proline dehydrogenase [Chloroherpeton thalassium ATCC 35110]|uniref:Proline dehydrogenase n=1 Tax=Chloroherpeton thalassium (strain ATCC 35110 / GB-78) TaxID=517418 RepID=B3QSL4_CHLT3|nr:proline dehydrogenase family protein [Chloroherpeton thalassium]ACF14061.1 Proline dehydrogenase [Chloroherpeton thalassium ATCC 35110]